MKSYVIRIYRQYEGEPERVVGLVEHPEDGAVERFSGVAELVNILLAPPVTAPQAGKKLYSTSQAGFTDSKEKVIGILNRYRIK